MDNSGYRNFCTQFVTDLVNRGVLARNIGEGWTLAAPILGYSGDVSFKTKEELIHAITDAAVKQYAGQTALKPAV